MEYRIKNTRQEVEMPAIQHSIFNIQYSVRRGFTALELLIVIAIMGVILATILPSFTNFRRSSLLNTESQELVSIINRARILSVSSKYDDQFGVHFEAGKVVLFQGDTYSPSATTNEEHVFDTAVILSPIVINGGGSELLFEKITGATSQNATTTLLVVGTTSSTTILVLPTGIVTIN